MCIHFPRPYYFLLKHTNTLDCDEILDRFLNTIALLTITSKQSTDQTVLCTIVISLEKFHEQLPLPVPCYDLVPVIEFTVIREKRGLRVLPTPLT